jgi:hypothetical protein
MGIVAVLLRVECSITYYFNPEDGGSIFFFRNFGFNVKWKMC